jgi:hypothetical protein
MTVNGYDFPHTCDDSGRVIPVFKRPAVDTEFDTPGSGPTRPSLKLLEKCT